MAFKQLGIETWGTYSAPQCSVRIKRQSDRTFYDVADGSFKPESNCQNPWVLLGPSSSPNAPNCVEANVDINPKYWTDGDYTVYFHNMYISTKPVTSITEVSIFNGDFRTQKPTSPTEIVSRLFAGQVESHRESGTVGEWMNNVMTLLKEIKSKL